MSIYMSLLNEPLRTSKPVHIGQIVKQEVSKLHYRKALENLLGQSDQDYFVGKEGAKKVASTSQVSHAQGVQNVLEKGSMF